MQNNETPDLTHVQVATLMKTSLEYNAFIVALAAMYYGNINDKRSAKEFTRDLMKRYTQYQEYITELLDLTEPMNIVRRIYGKN